MIRLNDASKVREGSQIQFFHQGEKYTGTIDSIVPMTKNWKYIISSPRDENGEEMPPIHFRDGDEEEWQIDFAEIGAK